MKTDLLNSLYEKYDIASYTFGAIHDKLGDVYEEFCVTIMNDPFHLEELKNNGVNSMETDILDAVLSCYRINVYDVVSITATNIVPHRETGGNSKTDIITTLTMIDNSVVKLSMSCKQSTVRKVALAEFDVDTICREMNINNPRLEELLLKHQTDKSAINFTNEEKTELSELMAPIARDFVRWVLTGSPEKYPTDVRIPTSVIRYKLTPPVDRFNIDIDNGDFDFISFEVLSVEESIDQIMLNNNGTIKSGGFGTGLSWTYATGSSGRKMQFKG